MTRKNPHAVALGRKGGRATSDAKADAARANGKRGGRPKRDPAPPSTRAPRKGVA